MKVTITARHLELTKALHDYAEKRVKRVKKYFTNVIDAHIILTLRKYTQIAEVIIHTPGITINGKEEAGDMYAAIDLVMDNIQRQVKKYKEKLKAKSRLHRAARRNKIRSIKEDVTSGWDIDTSIKEQTVISEIKKFDIKPMSFEEAVTQMKVLKHDQWAFVSRNTGKITFIYKKAKGSYGIIEPNY